MTDYDIIVVGAGIFGSCAAYHSQMLGKKTLLLEQFELNHKNGSSHGNSRIIRYAHTQKEYLPVVHDAFKQIATLEKRTGQALWRKTGLLWAAPPADTQNLSNILTDFKCEHEVWKGSEINSKYPQFHFEDDFSAIYDPMGGIIFADKWIKAFQTEFVNHGGVIQDKTEVYKYFDGPFIELTTSKGQLTAHAAIFTVGAWIGKMFPTAPLDIQAEAIAVCYWKPKDESQSKELDLGKWPAFIATNSKEKSYVYSLPSVDYPGAVKFCNHHGDPIAHGGTAPETPYQKWVDIPKKFIEEHVPMLDTSKPFRIDKCKYTLSEDDHYIIDRFPTTQNIYVGGCGSGSGFKVAPCIGRVLAEMAAGQKPSVDVSFFSFKRFSRIAKI